jgi:hypothetical protein
MAITFKNRFWKYAKWLIVLFVAMFVFRLAYGYATVSSTSSYDYMSDFFSNLSNVRKNYATEKKVKGGDVAQQASIAEGQKYEKTATIKSKTSEFEKEEKTVKDKTKTFQGVIQYEQNTGNKGNRELHLMIGIKPNQFDTFSEEIQKIGEIRAKEITKIDKTNEYRQLNAKKASLIKTLNSLNELKSKGGAISDFVSLHDKILEIESQLQTTGVELGNFDTENEFCTVLFSLYEGSTKRKISFIHRVKVALEWVIPFYLGLIFAMAGAALFVFLLLLVIEKLKILKLINGE